MVARVVRKHVSDSNRSVAVVKLTHCTLYTRPAGALVIDVHVRLATVDAAVYNSHIWVFPHMGTKMQIDTFAPVAQRSAAHRSRASQRSVRERQVSLAFDGLHDDNGFVSPDKV